MLAVASRCAHACAAATGDSANAVSSRHCLRQCLVKRSQLVAVIRTHGSRCICSCWLEDQVATGAAKVLVGSFAASCAATSCSGCAWCARRSTDVATRPRHNIRVSPVQKMAPGPQSGQERRGGKEVPSGGKCVRNTVRPRKAKDVRPVRRAGHQWARRGARWRRRWRRRRVPTRWRRTYLSLPGARSRIFVHRLKAQDRLAGIRTYSAPPTQLSQLDVPSATSVHATIARIAWTLPFAVPLQPALRAASSKHHHRACAIQSGGGGGGGADPFNIFKEFFGSADPFGGATGGGGGGGAKRFTFRSGGGSGGGASGGMGFQQTLFEQFGSMGGGGMGGGGMGGQRRQPRRPGAVVRGDQVRHELARTRLVSVSATMVARRECNVCLR